MEVTMSARKRQPSKRKRTPPRDPWDDIVIEGLDQPQIVVPPSLQGEGMVTVAEAAAHLRVSRETVYTQMRAGALAFVKIGTARRIPKDALRDFLARHRQVSVKRPTGGER